MRSLSFGLHQVVGNKFPQLIKGLKGFHESSLFQNEADFIDLLLSCRTTQVNTPIPLRILLGSLALSEPNHHLPAPIVIPLSFFLIKLLSDLVFDFTVGSLSWLIERSLLDLSAQIAVTFGRWRFERTLERLILSFGRHNCYD